MTKMNKQKNQNYGIAILASFINQQNQILTNFLKQINEVRNTDCNIILEQHPINIQTLQMQPIVNSLNEDKQHKIIKQYNKSQKIQLQCKYCLKKYTSRMSLINHLKIVHSDINEASSLGLATFFSKQNQLGKQQLSCLNEDNKIESDFKLIKSYNLTDIQINEKLLKNIQTFEQRKKIYVRSHEYKFYQSNSDNE